MRKMSEPQYVLSSDDSILVKFGEEIDSKINSKVLSLSSYLTNHQIPEIKDFTVGYSTVLIFYDSLKISHHLFLQKIKEIVTKRLKKIKISDQKIVEIPVLYSKEFGLDLDSVANQTGLALEEIIDLHTSKEYIVYTMGFSPGFPYLGGLDNKLDVPRLKKPRIKVEKGSVGITGNQTGIYPIESPGGWNIIGRTPLELFNSTSDFPTLLKPGDKVKFFEITTLDEFDQINHLEGKNFKK